MTRRRGLQAEVLMSLSVVMVTATSVLGAAPATLDIQHLAAWTVVANVLLNLDETLTKD